MRFRLNEGTGYRLPHIVYLPAGVLPSVLPSHPIPFFVPFLPVPFLPVPFLSAPSLSVPLYPDNLLHSQIPSCLSTGSAVLPQSAPLRKHRRPDSRRREARYRISFAPLMSRMYGMENGL